MHASLQGRSAWFRACRDAIAAAMVVVALSRGVLPARALVLQDDRIGERTVASISSAEPTAAALLDAPDVRMPSGLLVTGDGRTLWSRGADVSRAMASTTKIMTAILVLEKADPDAMVEVSPKAAKVGQSGVGLRAGERLTVSELMESLLVKSGNDAAVALAEHMAGSTDAFVRMMNSKAKALDLKDTRFTNPHGLDAKGHVTTASDLATLSRYAMSIPEFRSLVGLRTAVVTSSKGTRRIEASNKLLGKLKGANGVKTGWTDDAGYCVVASARRGGIELYAVVLGMDSENGRFKEATELLEWGFRHYTVKAVTSANTTVGTVAVADYLDVSVPVAVAEATSAPVFDADGKITTRLQVVESLVAPVEVGQRVGTLTVVQGDRLLAQVPVVAREAVPEPTMWQRLWIGIQRAWRAIAGGSDVPSAAMAVRTV